MKNSRNLLTGGWGQARTASYGLQNSVTQTYQQSLGEAERFLAKCQREASGEDRDELEELKSAIKDTGTRMARIRRARAEDWDASLSSFNAAWRRLRNAVKKTKKAFKKYPVHPSRHWSF